MNPKETHSTFFSPLPQQTPLALKLPPKHPKPKSFQARRNGKALEKRDKNVPPIERGKRRTINEIAGPFQARRKGFPSDSRVFPGPAKWQCPANAGQECPAYREGQTANDQRDSRVFPGPANGMRDKNVLPIGWSGKTMPSQRFLGPAKWQGPANAGQECPAYLGPAKRARDKNVPPIGWSGKALQMPGGRSDRTIIIFLEQRFHGGMFLLFKKKRTG